MNAHTKETIYTLERFSVAIGCIMLLISVAAGCSDTPDDGQVSGDAATPAPHTDNTLLERIVSGSVTEDITIDQDPSRWREVVKSMPVHRMKPGHMFYFGSDDAKYDQIILTLTTDSTANVVYKHRWAFNGNNNDIREEIEVGDYSLLRVSATDVKNDNEYWPITDSAVVLFNDDFGFDNGYKSLSKRFCFAKSKSRSSGESGETRLYPWLDPVNYPSRNGEYAFSSSHGMYKIGAAR